MLKRYYLNNQHGRGIYLNKEKEFYEGSWEANMFNGYGLYMCNGDMYKGEFREGFKHGYGHEIFHNFDQYKGEF